MPLSPIVIALVVVVVVLLGIVGYFVLFGTPAEVECDACPVSNCETSSEDCNALGYYSNAQPASESTCKSLGYSLASTSAPVTTSTKFCTNLSSNISLYAANVATYYSKTSLFKVVPASIASTTLYYGNPSTKPVSGDMDALKSFRSSANEYKDASFKTDFETIWGSAKADGASLFNNTGVTMTVMTNLMNIIIKGTATFSNSSLWKKYGTDELGNTWYSLETSAIPEVIKSGFSTIKMTGNDYNSYCD
jgi:hypothetical protein